MSAHAAAPLRARVRLTRSLHNHGGDVAVAALVVALTLVLRRDLLLRTGLPDSDVLTLWQPIYSHLGAALRAGRIPEWDPYLLSGHPFASDPQSGWMYLPAMLFSTLADGAWAVRLMMLAQPILAGWGLYAFLRGERFSRGLAATGSLSLVGLIAGSRLDAALPFAATLAWMALALCATGRLYAAQSARRRIAWLAATCLSLGQAAAAHLSLGLAMTVAAVAVYAAICAHRAVAGGRPLRDVAAWTVSLIAVAPALSAAYLLPRLAYRPATELGRGYAVAFDTARALAGLPPTGDLGRATAPAWPLTVLGRSGAHIPAIVVIGVPVAALAAMRGRRRGLVLGFGGLAAASYLLSLRTVASRVPSGWTSVTIVDFYLHQPAWLGFLTLFALIVVAVCGIEALLEQGRARRLALVAAGAIVVAVAGHACGIADGSLAVFATFSAVAGAGVVLRPRTVALLPVVVIAELLAVAWLHAPDAVAGAPQELGAFEWRGPSSIGTAHSALAARLRYRGRVLVLWRDGGASGEGAHTDLAEPLAGVGDDALADDVPSPSGYEAVVPLRYWTLARALQPWRYVDYNHTDFDRATPKLANLLALGWVVAPRSEAASLPPTAQPRGGGRWQLWRLAHPQIATVYPRWSAAASMRDAIGRVASASFNPAHDLVVEGAGKGGGGDRPTVAAFRRPNSGSMVVHTDAPHAGMLLVRESYDRNWGAAVDGHRARVHAADGAFMAVAVPAGPHTVTFIYTDPWIARGLLVSLTALLALAGVAALAPGRGPAMVRRPARRRW